MNSALIFFCADVLCVLDYGNVVHDDCSVENTTFPKVQISAAKFLKVYITITSHANVMGISSHATAFQSFASHSFSILFGQECSPQPPGKSTFGRSFCCSRRFPLPWQHIPLMISLSNCSSTFVIT